MNNDQLILGSLVEEIIMEVQGHGKYKELSKILKQAEKDGLIRWEEKNGKVFIFSLVDDQKIYCSCRGSCDNSREKVY